MSFLTVTNLSQSIGKKSILQEVFFEAKLGEVTVLLGPNGAGKTTLLKTIMGFHNPSRSYTSEKNKISMNGKNINLWSISKKVTHGLVYLPQQSSLFRQMSVKDNLQIVYEYQPCWQKKTIDEFNESRNQWLLDTNLTNTLEQKAETLSGGQKRKLEVVRSLLMEPKAIMLDEPFAGVDPKSIYELKTIFQDMAKKNISVIISDHNVDQLLSIATKVYVLIQGKVVASGTIKDILKCTHTKENYLGNQFYGEITKRFVTKEK
jgi:lipopolysaccharide export system ATP-binding protein